MAKIYADDIAYYLVNNRYPYNTFEEGRGYFWPREAFLLGLQRIWGNNNAGAVTPAKSGYKGARFVPTIQYPPNIRRIKYDYSRRSRAYGYTMPRPYDINDQGEVTGDLIDDADVNEWVGWVNSFSGIANIYTGLLGDGSRAPSATSVSAGNKIFGSEFDQFIDILDQVDENLQQFNSFWDSSNRCARSCQIQCQTACQTTCQTCNTSQCHNQKCGVH